MKSSRLILVLFILLVLSVSVMEVHAQNLDNSNIVVSKLRAGGGGGTGGGGGGAGTSGGTRFHGNRYFGGYDCDYRNRYACIFSRILSWIIFFVFAFLASIAFYINILRSSINSKRYIKMISKKDIAWKYKNIEKQVVKTYYIVQKAWTNMNMEIAREYMDEDLYTSFKEKIEWMEVGNKRNVLKKIKLLNLKPVSVHDDEDDTKDIIWFYIKGSMIDYTINTETNEKIDGNSIFLSPFVEFWEFKRVDEKWVLSKILQSDEEDKIIFQ